MRYGRFRQHVSVGLKAPFEKYEPRAQLVDRTLQRFID
tara:strand:- start:2024 stop:2137 length:114 start_codon:yes stop_codon:yes gene_type:complete